MPTENALIPVDGMDRWMCAWHRESVANGFISRPYNPDEAALKRLVKCFEAGLAPGEAAQMMFCARH
ncbi:hypothetical protein P3T23_009813 [Paraburkholderia sp. GAS448]|uniref:hypothetical protein n=1 Tax=Paraburkholderia sp. GAS448 TaxID=3035136 RepID=UPI003D231CA3